MIDEIVGLGQNEAVEKLCRDEAKQFRRDAETLRDTLIIPTEPTKPPTYRPSSEIAAELEAARNIEISRSELEKVIARAGPEPVAPVKIRHSAAELTALEDHERQRLVVEVEHRSLTQRIAAIPDVVHTSEQLDAAQEWLDYWDEVDRRGPQPTMLLETVEELLQQWHDHSAVEAMEEHEVTCPKCRHAFLTKGEVPPPPSTPMAVLWQERDRNLAWATPVARPEMDAPAEPLTRKELGVLRQGLAKQDEKSAMMAELSALVILEDHAQELRDSRVAAAEWNAYEREHAAWLQRAQASSDAAKALSELPVAPDIGELSAARTAAAVYESQQVAFVEAAAAAEKLKERISSKTAKAESYKSGAEALQRSRAQFKAFLAPSLGRVASSLLHQMTDGRLSSVIVDEEMNILVDGQEVSTLSGAQETIANIALRLALGRVLFSKVFPVFLGDEIDAYSDEEMVQSTALALGSLRSQLQQIILISHKQIDFADHHIEISKRPELERT